MDAVALKRNIAENIAKLRQSAGLTQAEFAQKLNYTDKAVSKWERAESIPDVAVLKQIADMFSVTVDFLLESHSTLAVLTAAPEKKSYNRLLITLLSVISVWFIATVVFIVFQGLTVFTEGSWMVFIFAIPASAIVLIVFNCMWGRKVYTFVFISVLIWSTLLTLFLLFIEQRFWLIFAIGIPAEVIVLLSSGIKINHTKKQ